MVVAEAESCFALEMAPSWTEVAPQERVSPWEVPSGVGTLKQARGVVVAAPRRPAAGALALPQRQRRLLEGLRLSHGRVLDALGEDGHAVIGVCSAVAGEGKTTVALGLARLLAEEFPRQLLLIDAHLQRPQLHSLLETTAAPGVSDCLESDSLIRGAIRWSDGHWLMPAGERPAQSVSTWEGQRDLLRTLRALFRVTLVDMPPALAQPQEAALIARWADAVIWVVAADASPVSAVAEAMDVVGRDKVAGVVLNKRRSRLPGWLQRIV